MILSSIILSAGSSRRMGSPKALLKIGDKTFLQHIIDTLIEKKFENIVVVLGSSAGEVRETITDYPVKIVINQEWQQGQLSSLIAGINVIDKGKIDGVLVWPVDHPLVSGILIDGLLNAFENDSHKIVIPKYMGRRGHPVIFPKDLFNDLRTAPLNEGARSVVHNHPERLYELESSDPAILTNIDTMEDYIKYVGSH